MIIDCHGHYTTAQAMSWWPMPTARWWCRGNQVADAAEARENNETDKRAKLAAGVSGWTCTRCASHWPWPA